jgi:hypothetical protein
MTQETRTEDDALYVVSVHTKRGQKKIQELMTKEDKERTGLVKLTDQEWTNLNAWLDTGKVVAPGPISH